MGPPRIQLQNKPIGSACTRELGSERISETWQALGGRDADGEGRLPLGGHADRLGAEGDRRVRHHLQLTPHVVRVLMRHGRLVRDCESDC